ncbi:ABC transporter substrate-binding protein [Haliovirga abyssi]|uniref:ABC transporter substrate-binding protein n=1 Tax=Haliovirga abyssi TaxID=2996794 RepID=A0AAU9DFZ1_9FUSO|nr:ABC transporter substrate-binding protein [Haliovirga abyssi]BDU51143.1 ABC transporter substrate-binding protein [Haliovirga abyssi]
MKKIILIFMLFIVMLTFGSNYPIKIHDSYGRDITINKEPNRIVSLSPAITETIFALKSGEKLVGRTIYGDYPKEVKKIEAVGDLLNPNLEKIIEINPDVVLASVHVQKKFVDKLESVGITVVTFYNDSSINGAYKMIRELGEVLNKDKLSEKIINNMKSKISKISEKVKNLKKPTVYYVVGYGKYGDYSAGAGTYIDKMITLAGGENIVKIKGWKYSLEKLIEKDPEIIVVSKYYNAKEDFKKLEGYKELSAVKNNKIFEIDDNLLNRQSARLADGIYQLAKIFHTGVIK